MTSAQSAYSRFIILSQPRTGSTLLAEALNSSPEIRCFGEIFNFLWDAIDYRIEGYDIRSADDLALRIKAPRDFLRSRIFCEHPGAIRAVGFKFHYQHYMAAPGVWQALQEDEGLSVIHLQRRNLLRVLISDKLAERTGVYELKSKDASGSLASKLTPAKVFRAIRHPLQRIGALRPSPEPPPPPKVALPVQPDEFRKILHETELSLAHWAKLFDNHPTTTLFYEDMAAALPETFEQIQEFLGLVPRRLSVNLVRQNPDPLATLIDNFDELYAEFRGTSEAWMFEE